MTLIPGTRLGPYEIVSALGAGGMGEVYRARDTRLGRDVAVKVLHPSLSGDAEVRNRFEREARTISSLNHPHICTLYDVGQEDYVAYLVMELVDGETLAQRLADGPLPTAEVLKIGSQIADALDRAHRAHVIHRDLKPGNVMLTKSGAKLMDFGLARPVISDGKHAGRSGLGGLTESPTIAQPLTAEGSIVGTFQYMAPEQLAGGEADERSDLWSLGCVLYEMVTGKSAFEGKSQAHLIAAVMHLDPRPMTELAPMTPPSLDQLVRALLAKDPEERIQTAHDVKLQLQWIAEGGSKGSVPAPVAARRRVRERSSWIVAAVLLLVAAALGVRALQAPRAPTRAKRVSILPPENVTIDDDEASVRISPDGEAIVFMGADLAGTSQLWIRELAEADARPLLGTAQAYLPFWSPDSRFIGFFADGKLKKVDRKGSNVEILCNAPDGRGGAWSSRGVILFAPVSAGGLSRVSDAGGPPTAITTPDTARHEVTHRFPCFLPDGNHYIFLTFAGVDSTPIRFGSLDSRTSSFVVNTNGGVVYAAPGHLLFARNGSLMVQAFDESRGRLTGTPRLLGPGPGVTIYGGCPPASVSTTGTIVQRHRVLAPLGLAWLDRAGRRIGEVPVAPGPFEEPALSPDDRRVVLRRTNPTFISDIWTIDLGSGVASPLTSDLPLAEKPVWSPDGESITFSAISGSSRSIYRVRASGGGEVTTLWANPNPFVNAGCWTPDGHTLVVRELDPVTGEDIWALTEGSPPIPIQRTRYHEVDPQLSPDGKWLVYRSNETGRSELYLQSFPTPEKRVRVSTDGAGGQSRSTFGMGYWRKDGRELIYVAGDGASVMSATVETTGGLRIGAPRRLFAIPARATALVPTSDLTRFLILEERSGTESLSLQMTLDWPAQVRGR